MQLALRIDDLEAIIGRILGLEASYEVRLCWRSGTFRRTLLREVPNDKSVRWRDVPFTKLRTVGELNRAIEQRYGFKCLILDAHKAAMTGKTRLSELGGRGVEPLNVWRRIVGFFTGA